MRIAINISGLFRDDGWREMVISLFKHMAQNWPAHEFIFITATSNSNLATSKNIANIVLANPAKNLLRIKLWDNFSLQHFLKQQKVDLIIQANGNCSLRGTTTQILFVRSFDLESSIKKGVIKKKFQSSLAKAAQIVVFDPATQSKLLENGTHEAKITVANLFVDPIVKPMEWQEKEFFKEKYSEGKEFFLYEIDEKTIDPLILLKAFSLFKKRQQSNMQFLLVARSAKSTQQLSTKLATYKYRNDVKILEALPKIESIHLLCAAYCLLYFSGQKFDLPVLNAMQAGVPIIVLGKNISIENNAALYAEADNIDAVTEQMKTIYKDETLRSRLIASGIETTEKLTIANTTNQVWEAISKFRRE